jgi:glycosyltransferase involved in cell wall biosynthesis
VSDAAPVSVIVPTHDGERYIAETIDSILAQTLKPAEVIVVDDGSTDNGPAIAAAYGAPVRVLHQNKSGAGAARNRGVKNASQPFLAFLDHDDLWEPTKLAAQFSVLGARAELAGIFGLMCEFMSPDVPAEVAARFLPKTEAQPSTLISCLLIRAGEFHRVGPLDPDSRADFVDWYMRARDLGLQFDFLQELVVRRRVHGRNTSLDAGVKSDYLKHIKASLDRRRAGGTES